MTHERALAAVLSAATLSLASPPALAQTDVDSPPVANAGGPYVVECQGETTVVQMDGTGSYDPDGTPLTFYWFHECPGAYFDDPTSPTPLFVVTNPGQCGYYCQAIDLTVTSGGQSTKTAEATVTIQDTQAPVLAMPGNVYQPWGLDTSPATMGQPVAVDACDPAPALSFLDQYLTSPDKGVERIIRRTWVATDLCGNRARAVQMIFLLGPSFGASNLEIDPSGCSDDFVLADPSATLTLYLGGRPGFDVMSVDPTTLHFSVRSFPSGSMQASGTSPLGAADWIRAVAKTPSDCNPQGQDVYFDLPLVLDRNAMRTVMGLDAFAGGPPVLLTVAGQKLDGTWFYAWTQMSVK